MVGETFDVDTCFAKVGMRDFLQGNPKQRTCPPPTTNDGNHNPMVIRGYLTNTNMYGKQFVSCR